MMSPPLSACRSWLFTPATMPDRFPKAATSGADMVIIDLEDAVPPADKDRARTIALDFLAATGAGPWTLRLNPPTTTQGLADLLALAAAPVRPRAIILPKTESADVVQLVDQVLGGITPLIPLLESARGVESAATIAGAPNVGALFFGAADYASDIGGVMAWEPLLWARCRILNAAAQTGRAIIDSPFFDLNDSDALAEETAKAVRLGFTAKAAIHPRHVGPINAALTPSDADRAEAQAILDAIGQGVGVVGGKMVDEAMARRARRILATGGRS